MSMLILILAVQILLLTTFASAGDRGDFARTMNPKRLHMKEKLTHLRVYWHDVISGQAQGFYAGASQHETSFLMAMNFAFKTGKYNGSTITILGRNTIFSEVRKMSVVGGRGIFRLARGSLEGFSGVDPAKKRKTAAMKVSLSVTFTHCLANSSATALTSRF
ncbi:unnamed protein product, partial [Brassica napus]